MLYCKTNISNSQNIRICIQAALNSSFSFITTDPFLKKETSQAALNNVYFLHYISTSSTIFNLQQGHFNHPSKTQIWRMNKKLPYELCNLDTQLGKSNQIFQVG